MARLFENVKMDIQAERRATAEAERKLEETERELKKVRSEADKAFEICRYIIKVFKKGCSESEITESLMQKFSLTREQAEDEYRKVMEE